MIMRYLHCRIYAQRLDGSGDPKWESLSMAEIEKKVVELASKGKRQ